MPFADMVWGYGHGLTQTGNYLARIGKTKPTTIFQSLVDATVGPRCTSRRPHRGGRRRVSNLRTAGGRLERECSCGLRRRGFGLQQTLVLAIVRDGQARPPTCRLDRGRE